MVIVVLKWSCLRRGILPKDSPKVTRFAGDFLMVLRHLG